MPPNVQAAQATEAYRGRLVVVRDTTATAVGDALAAVDLNLRPDALGQALRDWQESSAELVEGARLRAAEASRGYLLAYLAAVGEDAPLPDDPPGVDVVAELLGARKALLYVLGQGAGRVAAQRYGRYVAERKARGVVGDAAREVLSAGIRRSPRIVGWRRVTASSTCSRCAALTGRMYRDSERFPRAHQSCRCTAEPVIRDLPEVVRRKAPEVVAA